MSRNPEERPAPAGILRQVREAEGGSRGFSPEQDEHRDLKQHSKSPKNGPGAIPEPTGTQLLPEGKGDGNKMKDLGRQTGAARMQWQSGNSYGANCSRSSAVPIPRSQRGDTCPCSLLRHTSPRAWIPPIPDLPDSGSAPPARDVPRICSSRSSTKLTMGSRKSRKGGKSSLPKSAFLPS